MKNLRLLLCVLCVLCGKIPNSFTAAPEDRPNVLFIVCDDLNTHLSISGYSHVDTPNLDSLAAQSMNFRRAYCQYPVCGPSRASFLHGLYPESIGVINNTVDIRQSRPGSISMPQAFKEQGYWTASVGKVFHSTRHEHGEVAWHEYIRYESDELPVLTAARKKFETEHGSVEDRKNKQAWKKLSKETIAPLNAQTPPGKGPSGLTDEQHKDGKNARQVASWLDDKSFGDQPFFIALGIQKPHVPFLAPQKYFDQYPRENLEYSLDDPDLWESLPMSAISKRYTAFGFKFSEENANLRREYTQAYHACISFIDAQLAHVFDALKSSGHWEDTIVVFTSDHGYHLGDHFIWGKVTLFDIGARVPLLIRAPGITRPGSSSETIVELIDLYPTLAELAGIDAPDDLQGTSLLPVLKKPKKMGSKTHAYSVVSRGPRLGCALRDQQWRYGKWPDGEELYDLTADPAEKNNLAANPEYAPRLEEMRKLLAARQALARSGR